jgi:M6 family metalloprotease-like protein
MMTLILTLSLFSSGIQMIHAETSGSTVQNFANLVLFVQFSDTEGNFMDTIADEYKPKSYTEKAVDYYTNSSNGRSLVSYMKTISYGQFLVNTYMPQLKNGKIAPIILPKIRSYYDGTGEYTTLKDAITEANKIVSNNQELNLYGDDSIDNVTFIFAGEEGERDSAFYAHKDYYLGSDTINGTKVGMYNVLMADTIFGRYSILSTGEIAHEFLHSIGYPDLYHETEGNPVGSWDIMSEASMFMAWPLAYVRQSVSGWIKSLPELTKDTKNIILTPPADDNGTQAVILKTPLSTSEFFVVEYRKQGENISSDLDYKIPGSGLIVYRVNKNVEDLSNKKDPSADGIYIFRPGDTSVRSDAGDISTSFLSRQSNRTTYGSSDMNASISNNALVYSNGQNSGIVISNVGDAGNTISFDVAFADTSKVDLWQTLGNKTVVEQADSSVMSTALKENAVYPSALVGGYSSGLNSNLSIYEYVGNIWKQTTDKITDYSNDATLVYVGSTPYVIYTENQNYKVKLVRYVSGKWETVSTELLEKSGTVGNMTVSGSALYITWLDSLGTSQIPHIARYDGTFTNLYTGSEGNYGKPSISSADGSVYAVYRNASNQNRLTAVEINTSGVHFLPVPSIGYEQPVLCGDGTDLYLLGAAEYTSNINDPKNSYLYHYSKDHTTIEKITAAIPAIGSNVSTMVVYQKIPFVQTINQTEPNATNVYRYTNGAWVKEGESVSLDNAAYSSIQMIADICYVGMISSDQLVVKMKHISTTGTADSSSLSLALINAVPLKKDYQVGDAFKTEDLTVKGIYTNNSVKVLGIGTYSIMGFDTSTAGTKTITVTYGTLTDSYQISVTGNPQPSAAPAQPAVTPAQPAATQPPVVSPTAVPAVEKEEMYRLYNPNSGEHFFTANTEERDNLSSIGWSYEGVAWVAPKTSNTPVYRLYNDVGGEHHYTTGMEEADTLTAIGWSLEGVGWYSDDAQEVPLYRMYNPNAFANNHHYTTSEEEKDYLVSIGWSYEGIGWYGCK